MSYHSISQTCFFVAPDKPSKKRKRSHIQNDRRAECFRDSQRQLDREANDVLRGENTSLIREVVESLRLPRDGRSKLPCGIIFSENDANVERVYSGISKALKDCIECMVLVDLSAGDCSNPKAATRRIVTNVIASHKAVLNRSRNQSNDLRLVRAWSQHQRQHRGDQRAPTVVVAIRNIEAAPHHVVQELVQAFTLYDIDFRLLCNISTSLNHLQECFTTKTIRRMAFTTFEATRDESALDKIVTRILVNGPRGLRLGYDAYNSLWSDHHNAHQSVDLFLSALKYARMCHHLTNKVSWVAETASVDLSSADLELARSLPSFAALVDDVLLGTNVESMSRVHSALKDDKGMIEFVNTCMTSIQSYKSRLANALQLFFIIKDNTKSALKSRSKADIYRLLLDRGLVDSPITKQLLMSIKVMRHGSLRKIFEGARETLHNESDRIIFQNLLQNLEDIMALEEDSSAADTKPHALRLLALGWKDSDAETDKRFRPRELQTEHELAESTATRTTNSSRKRAVETASMDATEKEKRFTELVDVFHGHVTRIFQDLTNHEHLVLHELFWFNFDKTHRAVFAPDIRLHLRAALIEPETFLGKCKVEPHTSTLFRLFQDSGQLINLYDWFQAFRQVYEPGVSLPEVNGGENNPDEEADEDDEEAEEARKVQQALFSRSVAELRFMGFFKTTKRKTDHVQKTVTIL